MCGEPFINSHWLAILNLDLDAKVCNFIHYSPWNLHQDFINNFPQLNQLVQQVIVPYHDRHDELIWKHTNIGTLSSENYA